MNKDNLNQILKDSQKIADNPTTGTAHNRNMGELLASIVKTNITSIKTIKEVDKESTNIEKENIKIQKWMLWLTIFAGVIAFIQIIIPLIRWLLSR